MVYTSNEKFYHIVIEVLRNGDKVYHRGGNIIFNTPTSERAKAKVYYSLSGAKKALKNVQDHISKTKFKAYIETFNPVYGI